MIECPVCKRQFDDEKELKEHDSEINAVLEGIKKDKIIEKMMEAIMYLYERINNLDKNTHTAFMTMNNAVIEGQIMRQKAAISQNN